MTTAPDGSLTGWGSHQPALRALARFTKIRSVIEFGSGPYSTHLFLDREAFPDLTSLVTLENAKDWADKVWVDDNRHALIIVAREHFPDISKHMKADFVFVDCAPHHTRVNLVPHALTLAPIVGVHDFGAGDLSRFGCKCVAEFDKVIQTVFVSNTIDVSGIEIE